MKLATKIISSLVLALGATAVSQSSASAGDSTIVSPDGGAFANFVALGEHFYLYDDACDGLVPRLQHRKNASATIYTYENHQGCHGAELHLNKDWAEGSSFYWRVCNVGGGELDEPCSPWYRTTA